MGGIIVDCVTQPLGVVGTVARGSRQDRAVAGPQGRVLAARQRRSSSDELARVARTLGYRKVGIRSQCVGVQSGSELEYSAPEHRSLLSGLTQVSRLEFDLEREHSPQLVQVGAKVEQR